MGGFKMKMNITLATTTTTGAPVSDFMKMSATTRRNYWALKIQGKKYCKSCNDKN
jgi:hypothetical protein